MADEKDTKVTDPFGIRAALVALKAFDCWVAPKARPRVGAEWTVMAAVLAERNGEDQLPLRAVAVATGSKCLTESQRNADVGGYRLADSHAEVVARRGFHRALLSEINALSTSFKGKETDFLLERDPNEGSGGFRLRRGVRLHLFSTHPPCGAAAIADKESAGTEISGDDHQRDVKDDNPPSKKPRLDQHRTGAKTIDGEEEDAFLPGREYHTALDALRRKPGRGEPTRSLSCSDKIMKWTCVGLQSSTTASVLSEPLELSSVIVLSSDVSEESLQRALIGRAPSNMLSKRRNPLEIHVVRPSDKVWFPFSRGPNLLPSPVSVVTCSPLPKEDGRPCLEVATNGWRQGCTKRDRGTKGGSVAICRRLLACRLFQVITHAKIVDEPQDLVHYHDLKSFSSWHVSLKEEFKRTFPNWPKRDKAKLDAFEISGGIS